VNEYEAKQEERRERLERAAARAEAKAAILEKAAHDAAQAIPLGQPILIGHHSEGRDRRYRARIAARWDRARELRAAAGDLRAKAAGVGTGGISSRDPEAVVKLRGELAEMEEYRELLKTWNAKLRKCPTEEAAIELVAGAPRIIRDKWGSLLRIGGFWGTGWQFPSYMLSNLGANIRRVEDRIKRLTLRETLPPLEPIRWTSGGRRWEISEEEGENRVLLICHTPGRLPVDLFKSIRRLGWLWSRTREAFCRQASTGGGAVQVIRQGLLKPDEAPAEEVAHG